MRPRRSRPRSAARCRAPGRRRAKPFPSKVYEPKRATEASFEKVYAAPTSVTNCGARRLALRDPADVRRSRRAPGEELRRVEEPRAVDLLEREPNVPLPCADPRSVRPERLARVRRVRRGPRRRGDPREDGDSGDVLRLGRANEIVTDAQVDVPDSPSELARPRRASKRFEHRYEESHLPALEDAHRPEEVLLVVVLGVVRPGGRVVRPVQSYDPSTIPAWSCIPTSASSWSWSRPGVSAPAPAQQACPQASCAKVHVVMRTTAPVITRTAPGALIHVERRFDTVGTCPENCVRSCHSPGMKRLTSVRTYRPWPSAVSTGVVSAPWPIAGIHGVIVIESPSTPAPVVASVTTSCEAVEPCDERLIRRAPDRDAELSRVRRHRRERRGGERRRAGALPSAVLPLLFELAPRSYRTQGRKPRRTPTLPRLRTSVVRARVSRAIAAGYCMACSRHRYEERRVPVRRVVRDVAAELVEVEPNGPIARGVELRPARWCTCPGAPRRPAGCRSAACCSPSGRGACCSGTPPRRCWPP